jgi:hypothetical protein
MSTNEDAQLTLALEVLIAAAIIGNGGVLKISKADMQSQEMNGKEIAMEVTEEGLTLTLEEVGENDNSSE